MRYWLHATLNILLSAVMLVGMLILSVVLLISLPITGSGVLRRVVLIVGPLIGLFLPPFMMTRVPCVCPKCGGRAKYAFAAFGNWLMPIYAYSCRDCDWSTYRWSAYWQRKHTRRM
jgi:hypothetical protein